MALEAARQIIEKAIQAGLISGASLSVGRAGDIVGAITAGAAAESPRREMQPRTLFDAGTLTESLATASIFAALTPEKKLNLNAPVVKHWPDFAEEGKEKVSIRHLLKHTSGLADDRPFFKELMEAHADWVGTGRGREYILGRLSSEQLEYPPTYQLVHSRLGYLALGAIAEMVTGETFNALFSRIVAGPLSLVDARFLPQPADLECCAATGPCPHRGRMLVGEVADPNAWAMGSCAGHAGLFISAADAARIGMGWAAALQSDGVWLPQASAADFIGPKAKYKMGWEMPTHGKPECGEKFSRNTIGCVSNTGCSLWIDLDAAIAVAFFATFLKGTPAWDPANIAAFTALLPGLHDAVRDDIA